jgi:hypothetical protein
MSKRKKKIGKNTVRHHENLINDRKFQAHLNTIKEKRKTEQQAKEKLKMLTLEPTVKHNTGAKAAQLFNSMFNKVSSPEPDVQKQQENSNPVIIPS